MDTKKKILIAEDEKPISNVLGLKLTNAGFEVTIVDNGEKVLAEVIKQKFDLLLLDLLMPGTDGWSVLEKLKGSNLKIIVTSNLGQEEDVKKAKALGAQDFLIKSDVPLEGIVRRVNALLA